MNFNKSHLSKKSIEYSNKELSESLKILPEKNYFPVSNSNYGILYEEAIEKSFFLNLPIEPIQDPNIFLDESRQIRGLKLMLVPQNEINSIKYLKYSLNSGKYKVIPCLNMIFNVSYNNITVKVKYDPNNYEIIIKNSNNKYIKDYIFNIQYKEYDSPKNILKRCIKFDDVYLLIFSFTCEIDGLFKAKDNFYAFNFKSFISYSCKKNDDGHLTRMSKDNIIVCETKSGYSSYDLQNQIIKKCKFLENFFACFPSYKNSELIFIGFTRGSEFIDFDEIKESNVNCLIINLNDENKLFGERLYCNNEEINMLKNLKDKNEKIEKDINDMKKGISDMKKDTSDIKNEIIELKHDIDSKFSLILSRLPQA